MIHPDQFTVPTVIKPTLVRMDKDTLYYYAIYDLCYVTSESRIKITIEPKRGMLKGRMIV